jgi:Xaa-Pro aminopeptidase
MRKSDAAVHNSRIKESACSLGKDLLLLTDAEDVRYLAGFSAPGCVLLVQKAVSPLFFIDTMNYELARDTLLKVNVDIVKGSVLNDVADFIRTAGKKKIRVDESRLTLGTYKTLKRSGARFIDTPFALREKRSVKDAGELRRLSALAKATAGLWRDLKRRKLSGLSEKAMARMLEVMMFERGYVNSFDTIAAAGSNSAYPHAVPTDKVLKYGEHALFDFGLKLDGYCSDLTRIWYNGRINPTIRELDYHVSFLQEKVIKSLRPGLKVSKIANEADEYFIKNGFGKYLRHSLGHGIGLSVHEFPSLNKNCEAVLKEGMVVTVEPGLYIPGTGGIRKEDMVVITGKGCEVLTV